MTLTDAQISMMQEDLVAEIVEILMTQRHITMEEALDMLYNSDLYQKLRDKTTGLYYQSAGYVYAFLQEEKDIEFAK